MVPFYEVLALGGVCERCPGKQRLVSIEEGSATTGWGFKFLRFFQTNASFPATRAPFCLLGPGIHAGVLLRLGTQSPCRHATSATGA